MRDFTGVMMGADLTCIRRAREASLRRVGDDEAAQALTMGLLTGKHDRESVLPADDVRGAAPASLTWLEGVRPKPKPLDRLDAVRDILTSEGRSLARMREVARLLAAHPVTA